MLLAVTAIRRHIKANGCNIVVVQPKVLFLCEKTALLECPFFLAHFWQHGVFQPCPSFSLKRLQI
jgi:hypothetical protein